MFFCFVAISCLSVRLGWKGGAAGHVVETPARNQVTLSGNEL